MANVQLYDKDGSEIFPKTKDDQVSSNAISGQPNVNLALKSLKQETNSLADRINEITGDKDAVTAIRVSTEYSASKTTNEENIKDSSVEWSQQFMQPTPEFPYTWKHTEFAVGETTNDFYEIIASFNQNETQTIYLTKDNTTSVKIEYPEKTDENGEPIEGEYDLTAFDNQLPEGWSETPKSINASEPYLYISTRKRVNGIWEMYSTPALLGKWSFDSKLEIKYQVTSGDVPTVDKTSPSPSGWGNSPEDDFVGKLWMITSTIVNEQPVINKDGNIWSNPILMAIVK